MDPRLLRYYERELQHLRDMGGEFAQEFPKVAGRLGLDGFRCTDPYVERLLEGFAFLAARIQLKIDAEFPTFISHLLEAIYPHYLAPTPSMTVAQFQPDFSEGSLTEGVTIHRGEVIRSLLGKGDQTACEYRTAQDVTLWPLEVTKAEYLATAGAVAAVTGEAARQGVKAGLRLRLRTTGGQSFNELALERLSVYLHGSEALPMRLYEQLVGNKIGLVAQGTERPLAWQHRTDAGQIRPLGFEDECALLPYTPRSFQGYRLVQEYFAFPNRFLFVQLADLGPAVRRCAGPELDIVVLLNRSDPLLENVVDHSHFALFCAPAVNLFRKSADRIHLNERDDQYHVVMDRARPMDFEVFQVERVAGYGPGIESEQVFQPLYSAADLIEPGAERAYYAVHREPRLLSSRQRRTGPRSPNYIGGELWVSLVDANETPYRGDLRQLEVVALCTNRDLPLHMSVGQGKTDFSMDSGVPVESVRCLAGPTAPKPSRAYGATGWEIISHLSLNYLSLVDNDTEQGAGALREMLALYTDTSDAPLRKQIEGLLSVGVKPVNRRAPDDRGPIAFCRGLEVTLIFDEATFEGSGVFLLGAVLQEFLARYASINSFTETVIKTLDRGEIMRWPPRIGRRHVG